MPQVPVLLIRDHGVTVWASSLEGVSNYLEVAEYIFRYKVFQWQFDCNKISQL
ncbi:hypothetical protein IQ240_24135 [Nodularia sp. LEGE 04288]|nr:hypothetical protein [Nodularia sp. LEGE 04288]